MYSIRALMGMVKTEAVEALADSLMTPALRTQGFLSPEDLDAIRAKADECDDEHRKRRGQRPRSTRCRQCATILTLVAHIRLLERTA